MRGSILGSSGPEAAAMQRCYVVDQFKAKISPAKKLTKEKWLKLKLDSHDRESTQKASGVTDRMSREEPRLSSVF